MSGVDPSATRAKSSFGGGAGFRLKISLGLRSALFLYLAFVGVSLFLYEPALDGSFLSDDVSVVAENPYVQKLSLENVVQILDPYGGASVYALNYSPVHLLGHAIEIQLFGKTMRGYHVVNVALHAFNALLLVFLLTSSGLSLPVSVMGSFLFLVHPANTETVSMSFQLKTLLSTSFALLAILAYWRHPGIASFLFAGALLTKISAAFALPVVGVASWCRFGKRGFVVPHWSWLLVMVAILVAVGIPELHAFRLVGQSGASIGADAAEHLRTLVAIPMRYLVIAFTSLGVSALQQPEPARSWLDPWWLGGCVALAILGWRSVVVLLRRSEESLYWAMAFAAYAPVSQIFPFMYPMADRYLYDVLPGLIGGVLLAARGINPSGRLASFGSRAFGASSRTTPISLMALLAFAGVSIVFMARTHDRAAVFRSNGSCAAESIRNYPEGIPALSAKVFRSAQERDAAGMADAMHRLRDRGFNVYDQLLKDPAVAAMAGAPAVQSEFRAMASFYKDRIERLKEKNQIELIQLARSLAILGQTDEAVATLQEALRVGGPNDKNVREMLRALADPRRSSP